LSKLEAHVSGTVKKLIMSEKSEKSEHSLETVLASLWGRREAGIKLPADANLGRSVTRDDIEYLCNYHYPYLQIMNTEADFDEPVMPEFFILSSGWILMDYGDAMCSSYSTNYCFANTQGKNKPESLPISEDSDEKNSDESAADTSDEGSVGGEGGGEGSNGGDGGEGGGTITKQQFDTVLALIKEAKKKGWAAIEVVAGTSLMQFYAWFIAKELGIDLYGFIPTEAQERRAKIMAKERLVAREERRVYESAMSPD
jgi:hypothetical protein